MTDAEFQTEMVEIQARAEQFAQVFGPDVIDTAIAAVDEALFIEGCTSPMYRGRLRRAALRQLGQVFLHKAASEDL